MGRAAGWYEHGEHRLQSDATMPTSPGIRSGSLMASGMVGRPGRIGHHVLRSMAGSDRLSDFDERVVSVADLFSQCRLDAEADLIMWEGVDAGRIVTPIARLFDDAGSMLVLGGPDRIAQPQWTLPVTLRSSTLPDQVDMGIVAFSAMTFTQFIGGDR